jgi:hypothetical protein
MILDDLDILFKGAIGSLTFGVYHMYITTKMINENNRKIQLKIDENNRNIQLKIYENNRRCNELFERIPQSQKKGFKEYL